MSLQSNSQPGNKMSAWKYFRDGRTSHPRHRDRVASSSKCISSKIFFTSPKGTSKSSSFFSTFCLATHTCLVTRWLSVFTSYSIYIVIACHRKYSQSEYRKAVVHSSIDRTFPSISAIQRYYTQSSNRAPRYRLCNATYFLWHGIK